MMSVPDYYSILEISSDATLEQIKRAYRRLVRQYHPDLNKQADDARIRQLNEAYAILSNRRKRALYDIQRLEELRRKVISEMLRHEYEKAKRAQKMTWGQGLAGFFKELRKELQSD